VIPPFQGQFSTFGFADLLQWMEMNRRSGRLTLMRGRDRRIVDWKDGEIAYVSSSHPGDRLGVFLNQTRAIPTATLHALLARNFTSGTNLTRLILDGRHDTLVGLSKRVETLARRLLFEVFEWRDGVFRYDPYSPVEKILRIRLKMRPQALAFQAVKRIDDARRRRRRPAPRGFREAVFEEDELDRRFWEVLARVGTLVEPEEARRRLDYLREFADRLRRRLGRIESLRPLHEDSAAFLRDLLNRDPLELSAIAPIAALDPFLTLDVLVLANSLVVNRRRSVATADEALERLGRGPVTVLAERLAASDFPRAAQEDRAAVAVRRASIAAAVAASRLAPEFGIPAERAYSLGLLHTVPYADLLAVVEEMKLAPGPFRAALIEAHRPLVGRLRAEGWSLPSDLEAVLTDEGADPRPAAALVRAARAALPDCALGPLPAGARSGRDVRAIATEVNRLFEYLGLPSAAVRTATPGAH
jgi:HD-like signal output (HDOD) protein